MADQQEDTGRIVVGVDGSEPSKQALRWAARQAELTGGVVVAVAAWNIPHFYGARAWLPASSTDQGAIESRTRTELEQAVEEALGSSPTVEVQTEVRYGTAASVLIDASQDAAVLVVGSRGLGDFSGLLLGSVAQRCTQHAACPVLVMRGAGE
ncbi:universal stress protein [Streptomyces sp. NPDC055400]